MIKYITVVLLLIAFPAMGQELLIKQDGQWICDGEHPRCSADPSKYGYYQFAGRHLGQFSGVSEVVPNGEPLDQWQTFLTEVISKRPGTNVVSLWADAQSVVDDGRVWGGFISARSGCNGDHLGPGCNDDHLNNDHIMDSQLIGLEIDVLNDGKPGVYPNHSKVGLQIVGFGKRLTNAIEVLNSDGGQKEGQWQNIFNVAAGAAAPDGTIFGVCPQNTTIGFDLRGSEFKDSAILLSPKQKVTFRNEGQHDSAIYRDVFDNGHLVIQAAPSGIRITNSSDSKNLIIIDNDGTVKTSGDIATPYGKLSDIVARLEKLEKITGVSFSQPASNSSAP